MNSEKHGSTRPASNEFSWTVRVPDRPLFLELTEANDAITQVTFRRGLMSAIGPAPSPLLLEAARQLAAYLAGRLTAFDLPVATAGTGFQQAVWVALRQVPYGETVSYGELAALAGRPRAARAVGGAVGKNPVPVIIPCHRVLAAGGKLGGFTGGTDIKRWLLAIEGHRFPS